MKNTKLVVNAVYLTFNGEQSKHGIGSPCVFLRLAGCPIRCYAQTLGVLCDTPESLERKAGTPMELDDILERVLVVAKGCKILTLTGGDPLWNNYELLEGLFYRLIKNGFDVSVETSGVVEWEKYRWVAAQTNRLSFVVDYKMPSAGMDVYNKNLFLKKPELADVLTPDDTVKFVIYDEKDFYLAVLEVKTKFRNCRAKLAFGIYWNGPLKNSRLVQLIKEEGLDDRVYLNIQLHKSVYSELYDVLPAEI